MPVAEREKPSIGKKIAGDLFHYSTNLQCRGDEVFPSYHISQTHKWTPKNSDNHRWTQMNADGWDFVRKML